MHHRVGQPVLAAVAHLQLHRRAALAGVNRQRPVQQQGIAVVVAIAVGDVADPIDAQPVQSLVAAAPADAVLPLCPGALRVETVGYHEAALRIAPQHLHLRIQAGAAAVGALHQVALAVPIQIEQGERQLTHLHRYGVPGVGLAQIAGHRRPIGRGDCGRAHQRGQWRITVAGHRDLQVHAGFVAVAGQHRIDRGRVVGRHGGDLRAKALQRVVQVACGSQRGQAQGSEQHSPHDGVRHAWRQAGLSVSMRLNTGQSGLCAPGR